MPDSFLTALQVVLPMALLMALGAGARTADMINHGIMRSMDKMTFRLSIPALLFKSIYETAPSQDFQPKKVSFAVLSLAALFFLAPLLRCLEPDRCRATAMGQAMMRTNYILFGIAVAESIYGEENVGIVTLFWGSGSAPDQCVQRVRNQVIPAGYLLLSILKNTMVLATPTARILMAVPFRLLALL